MTFRTGSEKFLSFLLLIFKFSLKFDKPLIVFYSITVSRFKGVGL